MTDLKKLIKKTPLVHAVRQTRKLLGSWRKYRNERYVQARYRQDWRDYEHLSGETLLRENAYPCLEDRTATTEIDSHYFYQGVWAAQAIKQSGVEHHVDVGSLSMWASLLTPFTHVTFIDIRPLRVTLKNFESRAGSILALPFAEGEIGSLSCLHVAEHIGLGRYGDPLDPEGTRKATAELARVLARDGNLYFSLPIGKPRVCFNAHRIHSPEQILTYFKELELVSFSAVDDGGNFSETVKPEAYAEASYACGMFHFTKR